jgi:hypothetical protein
MCRCLGKACSVPGGIDWPFVMVSRQFLIRVTFVMTINKSQDTEQCWNIFVVSNLLPSFTMVSYMLLSHNSQVVQTSRFSAARVLMNTCEMWGFKLVNE